ncbi:MAG: saccharopine dehydrogenase NADP-binding domain-containing protein, partial [Thermoprotei archaeon]
VHSDGHEVVVFDLNTRGAKEAVERVGGVGRNTVSFVEGDVGDKRAVEGVLRGADVAVSAVGPFYRFGFEVASAAVRLGVNYVDICDDPDATQAELSLDRLARNSGVISIVGMGWTPGLSNLLVKYLASSFDGEVDVDIYWVGSTTDSEGVAVIGHVFHVISRDTYMFLDGHWVPVKPVTGFEEVAFPPPIGTVRTYYVGHPEPLTIPMYLKVRSVRLKGALIPEEMNHIAKMLDDLGFLSEEGRVRALMRGLHPILPQLSKLGGRSPPVSGVLVRVRGRSKGEERVASAACVDSMRRLTGIPPAVVAVQLAEGRLHAEPGVYPPEGAVDPKTFLEALRLRQVDVEEE